MKNEKRTLGITALLEGDSVRQAETIFGEKRYSALDVVTLLAAPEPAIDLWTEIKRRDPELAAVVQTTEFENVAGRPDTNEGLSLEGMFRLVESIPSQKARKLKAWIARAASQHLLESENPEMLAARARRLYEQKGYSRRWIDKRLRGVSARQELTGEWYRRGASDSEQFRELTNRLMQNAFGMDVEQYRRYKNLAGSAQNLRDHMSDLELALTALGEMTSVALHQARDSHSFEQLRTDIQDAGDIVAQTRQLIERQSRRPIVHPGNHLPYSPPRRVGSGRARRNLGQRPGTRELADKGRDMHNPSSSHPVRTVA